MVDDSLETVLNLVSDAPVVREVIAKAAVFAAARGHEVEDWHCFWILLSEYEKDPVTVAAIGEKSIFAFQQMLMRLRNGEPVEGAPRVSPVLYRLIHRMYADHYDILRSVRHIGVLHFYLAFLSRPDNMVYSVFQMLDIDPVMRIGCVVDAGKVRNPTVVAEHFMRLHGTCLAVTPPPRTIG